MSVAARLDWTDGLTVVVVVHVVRRLAGGEEDGLELNLPLGLEVDPRRSVRRVPGECLKWFKYTAGMYVHIVIGVYNVRETMSNRTAGVGMTRGWL